jgi:hypothetical protein
MAEHSVLLQFVRAACALDGVAAEPTTDGVLLAGSPPLPLIPWPEIDRVLAGDDPVGPAPRLRLALLLQLRGAVQSLGPAAAEAVGRAARPLALPVGHPLHPGPAWIRATVPGGLLDLGLGVHQLLRGQDDVLPLPPAVVSAAGLDAEDLWLRLYPVAERLSTFAIDRVRADGPHPGVLVGVGGCDALTMLSFAPVRHWLATRRPDRHPDRGPEPVAAPRRDRVWVGPAAADGDYVRAVWLLTASARRGVLDPMTADPAGVRPTAPPPRRR